MTYRDNGDRTSGHTGGETVSSSARFRDKRADLAAGSAVMSSERLDEALSSAIPISRDQDRCQRRSSSRTLSVLVSDRLYLGGRRGIL